MQVTRIVEDYESYAVSFSDEYGAGFAFDSDSEGNILFQELNVWRWANLNHAIDGYCDGEYEISIQDYSGTNKHYEGTCDCGAELIAYGGYDEFACDPDDGGCGAEYNIWGQRLRADWRGNRSNWDSEIGDLEGYELQYAGDE